MRTAAWALLRADSGVGTATCGLQWRGNCYVRTTVAWVLLRADYSGVGTATCGLLKLLKLKEDLDEL